MVSHHFWYCSQDLLEPFSQFRGHGPKCSNYPHIFNFLLQPLVFFKLLVFRLPDVAVTWNCDICHYYLPLQFVRLVSPHQFISLKLEVSEDLSSIILFYLWRCFPLQLWDFQIILGTDVPVHHIHHLGMAFNVCLIFLHLTPCYNVLDCFRGLFAQPVVAPEVLSGVVDPGLYCSCA